jgi:phospholipid/cholesterol/gamma-HCH transport system ATP-binding protein
LSSPTIKLDRVSVSFGSEKVLHDVALSVLQKQSFVIVGPSGQGKSTLLKVIAGLIPPTTGTLFIEGRDFHSLDAEQRHVLIRKMGMLFQKNALFDSLTAFENVAFPLIEITDLSAAEIRERSEFFLNAVGLSHARDLYPDEISGGMQKRLGIARALALRPEIILYDDPTAGLDPITSRKIIELIQKLQVEFSSTIVTITNDMNRAYQLAHQIGVVLKGQLVLTGNPEQTKSFPDPRVQQFIRGEIRGPLTEATVAV